MANQGLKFRTSPAKLMTPELIATLCDHAQGNLRALMNMAGELLVYAAEREARQIDEKLFLETCAARRPGHRPRRPAGHPFIEPSPSFTRRQAC